MPTIRETAAALFASPEGGTSAQIQAASGVRPDSVVPIVSRMEAKGEAFRSRDLLGRLRWFNTPERALAHAEGVEAERRAARDAALQARADKLAEIAKRKTQRSEAAAKRALERALYGPPRGPKCPQPGERHPVVTVKHPRGQPLVGEVDESGAKITRVPAPPGRFEVPADFRGEFSAAGVGRDADTGRAWGQAA